MAVRLADLLAGLSRVADLGFGLPAGSWSDVRREVLPRQRHLANAFTPEGFAEVVGTFLRSMGPDRTVAPGR